MSLLMSGTTSVPRGGEPCVRHAHHPLLPHLSPSLRDPYGWTPLMRAADSGHVEVAELLLNRGADVNAFDSIGWTATHQAAANGHKAVLDLLLENGAAAGKQDSKKQMAPIHKAAAGGYRACVGASRLLDIRTDLPTPLHTLSPLPRFSKSSRSWCSNRCGRRDRHDATHGWST